METKEGKIKLRIGSSEYPVDILDLRFVDNGKEYTMKDLLSKILVLENQNALLSKQLQDSVAIIANAESLISTAHDGLSVTQAQNTKDIQELKTKVADLETKTKYL